MGKARIYSDAQRAAIYALHEQGLRPTEIARQCAAGLASVDAFDIPRTSVREICAAMAAERGGPPASLEDLADVETCRRFPQRALTLLGREMNRLERKERSGGLDSKDLDRLAKAMKLNEAILKGLQRAGAAPRPDRNGAANGQAPRSDSMLERLRAEEERRLRAAEPAQNGAG